LTVFGWKVLVDGKAYDVGVSAKVYHNVDPAEVEINNFTCVSLFGVLVLPDLIEVFKELYSQVHDMPEVTEKHFMNVRDSIESLEDQIRRETSSTTTATDMRCARNAIIEKLFEIQYT
jgi:uncharacterized protein YdcH (DUF465 family)